MQCGLQMNISRRRHLELIGVGLLGITAISRGQTKSIIQLKDRNMEITRAGSQSSTTGPTDWFTGTVRIDPLFQPKEPARAAAANVTFEPGARTAWHTHPLGQTLIITSGVGRVQREGGPIEEVRPGDVVWFPPGLRHWHGATPKTAMTHMAIQEALNGKMVDWMEKVTDEQYRA
jgi:quercetin dioxygenase-like cupin family protein